MTYQLYWGDLHNHCSISYGHGSVQQALARARQQLDFCSVTGHAFWPDMMTDRARYGEIIDYHRRGFARLASNWDDLLAQLAAANEPGTFVTLPSYEWHSLTYGDHNVYAAGPELALRDAADLPGLRQMARQQDAIIIPHHIGYAAGYRGIDWQHFSAECSPFVEIFSLHGASVSDEAPYPMLHDMGPRDFGSTAAAGWQLGHRFGIVASTDHHAAYPGSHGDGRAAVLAKSLSREDIWEALRARRVYAATGDKIDARLWVDGAWIGESIQAAGRRRVELKVVGLSRLNRVDVLKNERVVRRFFPDTGATAKAAPRKRWRLRLEWGWGRQGVPVEWSVGLQLAGAVLVSAEPCFAGPAIVSPQESETDDEIPDAVTLRHAIDEVDSQRLVFRSETSGNVSMRHAATQQLSLDVEVDPEQLHAAELSVDVGSEVLRYRLDELAAGARCHYLRGWLSEAIRVGPLVPAADCTVFAAFDDEPSEDVDVYRLRVAQTNGQWAWLSPIWVER